MINIDINFKNSKFYIVEVRVDDYANGDHSFYTSREIFISKREAENAKNNYFRQAASDYFREEDLIIPEDLSDYDNYDTNNETIHDSNFTEEISWVDSDNIYISAKVKELFLDTNFKY